MSKTTFMATGVLSALTAAAYYLCQSKRDQDRDKEEKMIQQQSVEEIIREIYMRVSTK